MNNLIAVTRLSLLFYLAGTLVAFSNEPETQLSFERSGDYDAIESHAYLGWESRYFSEG